MNSDEKPSLFQLAQQKIVLFSESSLETQILIKAHLFGLLNKKAYPDYDFMYLVKFVYDEEHFTLYHYTVDGNPSGFVVLDDQVVYLERNFTLSAIDKCSSVPTEVAKWYETKIKQMSRVNKASLFYFS